MTDTPTPAEKVPAKMRERFDAIVALTDDFCQHHLNADYAELARHAAAALSRKRPSPLARGRPDTWACGIVYALGSVNFLFDPDTEPYLSAAELCEKFGVGKSTGSAKSRAVQDALDMTPLDAQWLLPAMMENNPAVWMISVNGFLVDARTLPREIQAVAYEQGAIPYIPADRE